MKIGLLLGSFDPPHIGHISMIAQAFDKGMDRVFVVPCWSNPTKEQQTSFNYRYQMCWHTFSYLPNVIIRNDEERIKSSNTSEYLSKSGIADDTNNEYYIIVGSDIDISTWINGNWILEHFKVIHIPRLGIRNDVPMGIKCSSSDLRAMYYNGQAMFPYLNSETFLYIMNHKIYPHK